MPYRVVIVPDKFKGTLTAFEAAAAIEKGWRRVRPKDSLDLIPMSDGGDGFGPTLSLHCQGEERRVKTTNEAGEPIWAKWWWVPKTKTAIVETAQVIGLAQLPKGKFHPFELDTFGLGTVFSKVFAMNPKRCLIGLGGSATNDGGMGMARSLGWKFLDAEGQEIRSWTDLVSLREIEPPSKKMKLPKVIAAIDVRNRLLGRYGASQVFGPQKGLREEDMPQADACLRELSQRFFRLSGRHLPTVNGAGAAGGLGFGCIAFLNAETESGFELFAEHARLKRRVARADLVITGEGAMDRSTNMGKGAGGIAALCRELKIPCLGLAGDIFNRRTVRKEFTEIYSIIGGVADEAQAMKRPASCLADLAELAATDWNA